MDQSVVINPSGDPSGDFHPSSQAVVSPGPGDSVVVSKKSKVYICQFCDRVCRNAQALGGHMNVHRRERALAKQLLELCKQGDSLEGTSVATAGVAAAAAAASAGERDQDHLEVITHGGSSSSSSSPPSPQTIAIATALVHGPWRSLPQLPIKNRKRREAVDLELRLGFTPGRFL